MRGAQRCGYEDMMDSLTSALDVLSLMAMAFVCSKWHCIPLACASSSGSDLLNFNLVLFRFGLEASKSKLGIKLILRHHSYSLAILFLIHLKLIGTPP